jgi:triosephosphate isomerase (TIM)
LGVEDFLFCQGSALPLFSLLRMNKSIRKPLIAGNWKMNKTPSEAVTLVEELKAAIGRQTDAEVVVAPAFTALDRVATRLEGTTLKLAAQNVNENASGAFTGEVSASMLRELFVSYVILGHSERRSLYGESDATVNKKLLAAVASGLRPILCVGETLAEREAAQTLAVVGRQLREGLKGLTADKAEAIVVAYEPVWAIGTGKTATSAQAQEVHAYIRAELGKLLSPALADKIRILYGGSMKPQNAPELLAQTDIDGGLIGGAALEAASFVALVKAAL